MDKENQIAAMAKDIHIARAEYAAEMKNWRHSNRPHGGLNKNLADALYAAGYRKQSDTVKAFAEKVNRKAEIECDSDFNISIYNLEALTETIAAEFGKEDE